MGRSCRVDISFLRSYMDQGASVASRSCTHTWAAFHSPGETFVESLRFAVMAGHVVRPRLGFDGLLELLSKIHSWVIPFR